jgi:hypothetical protein
LHIVARESHRQGLEELAHHRLAAELGSIFNESSLRLGRGNTKVLKAAIAKELRVRGWTTGVKLDADMGVAINGLKNGVALQVQLGNMARAFYDLMKLQSLFQQGRADCAVLVLATQQAARRLGTNHAYFERISGEVGTIFSEQITIPLAMFAIE